MKTNKQAVQTMLMWMRIPNVYKHKGVGDFN